MGSAANGLKVAGTTFSPDVKAPFARRGVCPLRVDELARIFRPPGRRGDLFAALGTSPGGPRGKAPLGAFGSSTYVQYALSTVNCRLSTSAASPPTPAPAA